ncbi:MAG: ADP-heptose--LPS heptosyltransferase [Bacteroidota bacterium]|nr:ADP-heptose--LPS heptosyltransferase [Bacteroidota bacterium]
MQELEETFSEDPWMNAMLQGKFEEAWKISDAVLQERAGKPCWHLPRHQQYIWDGSSLENRRVLVRCYHGLGDTIQFIRFMPELKRVAKEVIVWAQPPLIPLLQTVEGIDRILPLHDGTPEVEYDVDIEIMELSHIFRSTLETIPRKIPYLHVAPTYLSSHQNTLSVGLVWKAKDWDPQRNIAFPLLKPLLDVPGSIIYILQGDAKAAGWQEGVATYPGEYNLYDYAGVIAGLDLLISIDSMPAHLAGALGVPVWTLLHASADWRWMRGRNETPWYPTMHLFRQQQQGAWEPVIQKVKEQLQQLAQTKTSISGEHTAV